MCAPTVFHEFQRISTCRRKFLIFQSTRPQRQQTSASCAAMQHDEVIWQVINQGFCSFKVKYGLCRLPSFARSTLPIHFNGRVVQFRTPQGVQNFCKNKQNVTGLCSRQACPLANSRYATIQEEEGKCYLWIKTIERAHSPKNMWEKILLSRFALVVLF